MRKGTCTLRTHVHTLEILLLLDGTRSPYIVAFEIAPILHPEFPMKRARSVARASKHLRTMDECEQIFDLTSLFIPEKNTPDISPGTWTMLTMFSHTYIIIYTHMICISYNIHIVMQRKSISDLWITPKQNNKYSRLHCWKFPFVKSTPPRPAAHWLQQLGSLCCRSAPPCPHRRLRRGALKAVSVTLPEIIMVEERHMMTMMAWPRFWMIKFRESKNHGIFAE